jgi:hypothetical protein
MYKVKIAAQFSCFARHWLIDAKNRGFVCSEDHIYIELFCFMFLFIVSDANC